MPTQEDTEHELDGPLELHHLITKQMPLHVEQPQIEHAAQLMDAVGRAARCSRAVDVGSGLGYLSRCLALEYGWQVVAVEGEASCTPLSRTRPSRTHCSPSRREHRPVRASSLATLCDVDMITSSRFGV